MTELDVFKNFAAIFAKNGYNITINYLKKS